METCVVAVTRAGNAIERCLCVDAEFDGFDSLELSVPTLMVFRLIDPEVLRGRIEDGVDCHVARLSVPDEGVIATTEARIHGLERDHVRTAPDGNQRNSLESHTIPAEVAEQLRG